MGKLAGLVLASCLLAQAAAAQDVSKFRVLYYNKSPAGAAYVHTSAIAAMKDSILSWGKSFGFAVDVGADASVMSAANLAKYRTVVFDNVSSETADALPQAAQRTALLDYIKTGGFVGIHAAAEAGRWPDLVALLGAKMTIHTSETNELTAGLNLDAGAANLPLVAGMAATGSKITLPAKVSLVDEWYSYTASPRNIAGVQVLYTLDEKTFTPAAVMGDHPIAWYRVFPGGGRMFYTGIGHSAPYLAQPFVKNLLVNAIFATAGMDAASGIGAASLSGLAAGFQARAAGPARLEVSVTGNGPHTLSLLSLDGKRIARRSGQGPRVYGFADLSAAGLVLIELVSPAGRRSGLAWVR
jgi:type 1 glutamine amidotransferase